MTKYLSIFILVFLGFVDFAQAQNFVLSGEIRPRFEALNGFGKLRPAADSLDNAMSVITQRSRLNMNFSDDKFKTRLIIQDVRSWGSVNNLSSSDNHLTVFEAWAEYMFTPEVSMKLGRQVLAYDNQRIFGGVDWLQQGLSHDIAVFKYENDSKFKLHFGYGLHRNGYGLRETPYTVNSYKSLQYLWLNKKTDKLSLSLLALNQGQESNISTATNLQTVYNQTIGGVVKYKSGKIAFETEGYYQMGENKAQADIAAYDFRAEVGVGVAEGATLVAGYEILSGTDQTGSDEFNSFSPWYGTNHKFNGLMDYFFVAGRGANSVGLQDIYFGGKYKKDKLLLVLLAHSFSAPAVVLSSDGTSEMESSLGTEIDLILKYQIAPKVGLLAGYSHLLATETLGKLSGGDDSKTQNWFHTTISFKPEFLNIKKEEK